MVTELLSADFKVFVWWAWFKGVTFLAGEKFLSCVFLQVCVFCFVAYRSMICLVLRSSSLRF